MRTQVVCKVVFEGVHHWPAAPEPVAYLAWPHRHEFVIRCCADVEHDDRDIEFIMLKHKVEDYLATRYIGGHLDTASCEQVASNLIVKFDLAWCSVFEDDENGAIVYRD